MSLTLGFKVEESVSLPFNEAFVKIFAGSDKSYPRLSLFEPIYLGCLDALLT
jgi:hypothetical protein